MHKSEKSVANSFATSTVTTCKSLLHLWSNCNASLASCSAFSRFFPQYTLPYTQYLSVILNRLLNREFGVKSNIKWPNDLLFEGKKISGILAEVKTSLGKMQGVALGVGINVNCDMSKFKELPNATSISSILGNSVNKEDLLNLVVEEFFKNFEEFSKQGFVFISDEYKKMCKFNDTVKISASSNNGEFKFDALNDDGTLSVLDENNKKITIVNGDILC